MGWGKYDAGSVKKGVRNPTLAWNEVTKVVRRRKNKLSVRPRMTDVVDRDWDNLLILDACRYDVFERLNTIEGDLDCIVSKGSHSHEFVDETFRGRELHDTIYVTANPFGAAMCEDVFFRMETTFSGTKRFSLGGDRLSEIETDGGRILRDNHIDNVRPELIRAMTVDAHDRHPHKRLITHFMQPHMPYIGPRAKALRDRLREERGVRFEYWMDLRYRDEGDECINDLMIAAKRGYITPDELLAVYEENLEIVLGEVEALIAELDGKTVITSDHGEHLGEVRNGERTFSHAKYRYSKELRRVPWLEINADERRTVQADTPPGSPSVSNQQVYENLEHLGYLP